MLHQHTWLDLAWNLKTTEEQFLKSIKQSINDIKLKCTKDYISTSFFSLIYGLYTQNQSKPRIFGIFVFDQFFSAFIISNLLSYYRQDILEVRYFLCQHKITYLLIYLYLHISLNFSVQTVIQCLNNKQT